MISVPECATLEQRRCVESLLEVTGNPPSLEQLSACVDFAWDTLGCNNEQLDWGRIGEFYNHPVWLLNGLFIEQHDLSQENRMAFVEAVKSLSPKRVADFGGGFGNLARMLAKACPETHVDIIEPHPTSVALELSAATPNIAFKPDFDGEYDVIIATDVFEHVPDPLADVERTSEYLKVGGIYLIANCFYPVIKCHLPCDFHFRYSFSRILSQMGLEKANSVLYGHMYRKKSCVRLTRLTRMLEMVSRKTFRLLKIMGIRPG
ncbi:MAG: class I SAM-dependent methyltransferase [Mariprofundaceae bacterium]